MDNLLLSFNVIAPLLLMLAVGIFLRKVNFVDEHVTKKMNRLVALFLLPLLVFKNIYNAEIEELMNFNVLLYAFVGIVLEFLIATVLSFILTKEPKRRGVMIQGMFRCNYVIFGIPIAVSLYGDEGSAVTAVLTIVVIPALNILAVFALELFNGNKISAKFIFKKIVTNPLIIASLLGMFFSFTKIELPGLIYKPLSDLASTATPMAFVFLGASLSIREMKGHIKELMFTVFTRLVLFPIIFITVAILLGFKDAWLVALLTVFASPTAVSSYSLAETLGGDGKLAGNIVVFTTAFSIVTMFLWVLVLKSIGVF